MDFTLISGINIYWEWIACEDFQMPLSARRLDHIDPESFAFVGRSFSGAM